MNMLNREPMKELVQRKVFDGRTNGIKEEKTWNEHINIL